MPKAIAIPPGTVFGRFTVVGEAPRIRTSGLRAMLCRCECGTMKTVGLSDLRHGRTASCGCTRRDSASAVAVPPGTVFGRLTAIEPARTPNGNPATLCQCECGRQKIVDNRQLRSGHTNSCGCLRHGDVADPDRLGRGEIPLYGKDARRRVVLVDDEDHDLVMQYRWYPQDSTRPGLPLSYAKTTIFCDGRRTSIFMHSLITGFAEVDHEDGNGLNNRRYNLRDATHAQNMGNARKQSGTTSRFKGVYWSQRRGSARGKWQAQIGVDHHCRYLGRFDDEEDAARAYDAAAVKAWGEFARLNFPGQVQGTPEVPKKFAGQLAVF